MYRAFKFRLYPDNKQKELINKTCGSKLDRDLNASINIMSEGLKLYMKEIYE